MTHKTVAEVEPVPATTTIQNPADVKYYPSDEPLKLGMEHFARGNYGTAQRYFRDAVRDSERHALRARAHLLEQATQYRGNSFRVSDVGGVH